MKKLIAGIVLACALSVSSAFADYTLVCQSGGSSRDVTVRGVGSFADACRVVNSDAAYSRYTGCIDAQGRGGACPVRGGAAPKTFNLTIVTRVRNDKTQRELGGRVHVGDPPGYGQFVGAPSTFKVKAGEVDVYWTTPTKDSACNFIPEPGDSGVRGTTRINVSKDMTYVVYFECQR